MQIDVAIARRNERNVNAVMPGTGVGDKSAEFRVEAKAEAGKGDRLISVIVKPDDQAVAAEHNVQGLPRGIQILDASVADLARTAAVFDGTQVGHCLTSVREGIHVGFDYFARSAIHDHLSGVNPNATRAQSLNGGHVVRNKKDRPAAATEPIHGVEAFALKARVADSQNLINDEDIRIEMGGHGKAQAQAHAGRVALDRCIQELCHAGKFNHRVQLGGDLAVFHAQYGAVQIDVLPAGEFLVKTGAHFEKRSDAARHVDFTGSGIGDFGQHFEKRALSGAIAPDDAHDFPGIDTK